jgi:hypothetical protein
MKFFQPLPKLIILFFLSISVVSCEKTPDSPSDDYVFMKGEWVIDKIVFQTNSSGGLDPDYNYSSTTSKYSFSNDSLVSNYREYRIMDGEIVSNINEQTKFAYILELSIDSSIAVYSSVSNVSKNINRDTAFTIQYETGDYNNRQPSLSQPDLESYCVKVPFGKNRFFITGVWYGIEENVLFAKKPINSDTLTLEYTDEISEQESYQTGTYYYRFIRKE